jgi:ketosteroid isomerase-like protein
MTMPIDRDLFTRIYESFNARDIDAVLAVMHPDVDWPNGWEGGRVIGHQAVREYWTRQWAAIDPRVEPVGFETDEDGRTVVKVYRRGRPDQEYGDPGDLSSGGPVDAGRVAA